MSGLGGKSAGTGHEKCLWSALLFAVMIYSSASRATVEIETFCLVPDLMWTCGHISG